MYIVSVMQNGNEIMRVSNITDKNRVEQVKKLAHRDYDKNIVIKVIEDNSKIIKDVRQPYYVVLSYTTQNYEMSKIYEYYVWAFNSRNAVSLALKSLCKRIVLYRYQVISSKICN